MKGNNKNITIEVFDGDCFRASEKYSDSVIHNFANNTSPGGPTSQFSDAGFLIRQKPNSNTQEDQIIHKYQHNLKLYPNMYPICDDSKINGEAILYSKCGLLKPVITIAAPINPNFKNKKIVNTIINRIHLMLYVSWKYNHTLITGLWGCGAFGANPETMAQLWEQAIKTTKFIPKRIVFAIILDEYSNKWGKNVGNYFNNIKLSFN